MNGHALTIHSTFGSTTVASGQTAVVGRDPQCDITIDHPLVSRRHARISFGPTGWAVEDLDSRNGLRLDDGARVASVAVAAVVTVWLGDRHKGPALTLTPAGSTTTPIAPAAAPAPPPPAARPPVPAPTVPDSPTLPSPSAGSTAGVPPRTTAPTSPARAAVAPPTPGDDLGNLTEAFTGLIGETLIGRSGECDIVLDDVIVSRRHARLRVAADGTRTIDDLDSHIGTYVNGRRERSVELRAGDVIGIGRHRMVVTDTGLDHYERTAGATFAARGLCVRTDEGKVLLDSVEFALDGSSFLGIVGPSGAGKSTLVGALTGLRPAQEGTVMAGGRDLYQDYEQVRHDIGFVPQDDVLHTKLTVTEALEYAAELRFPPDVSAAERRARVDEVIVELGLGERRDLRIESLSGGQRKRVSVALELLTRPSLLILDEPTSGLDPGYERALMQLLRELADGGRTVIVVTHSVESLHLCDRVLVLAVGGTTAYVGPPQLAPAALGFEDFQDLFKTLSDHPDHDWAGQFRTTVAHREYVQIPLARAATPPPPAATRARRTVGWGRQVSVLVRRHLRVLRADTGALGLLLASGPVVGLLILVSMPSGQFGAAPEGQLRLASSAQLVLVVLALAATLLGSAAAIREIVKEQAIFRRERAVGLSISAYVTAKLVVLGTLAALQMVVLTPIAIATQDGPDGGAAIGSGLVELILALAAIAVAAVALGLFVSALVHSTDQAMTFLPVIVVAQLILTATATFPVGGVSSTLWGYAATASTVDLNELNSVARVAAAIPVIDLADPDAMFDALDNADPGEPRFERNAATWLTNMAAVAVLGLAMAAATGAALRRKDPM